MEVREHELWRRHNHAIRSKSIWPLNENQKSGMNTSTGRFTQWLARAYNTPTFA